MADHLFGRTVLHDFAEIEHIDPLGNLSHDREIMRDEKVGQPELRLQALEEIDAPVLAHLRGQA